VAADVRHTQTGAANEQREGEEDDRYGQWPTIDYARGPGRRTVEPAATRRGVRRWIARVGPAAERFLCSGARCVLLKALRDPLHRRALCHSQMACRAPFANNPLSPLRSVGIVGVAARPPP